MAGQSILSMIGRGRTPDAPEQRPAAIAPPAPSAAERRLRLVVESAPVSLCILDPDSKVLAANRAALALLGIDRLHDVIGTPLDRLVVTEGRERFMAFVTSVCQGEAGTLEYELTAPGGAIRSVETHAVPLRREANATAAFLGVTWDVSEKKHAAAALQQLQQKWEQLEAQRSAEREMWEEALRGAKEAHRDASTGQQHVQTTFSDAQERHGQLTAEWAGERDALIGKLTDAEERQESLAAQLLSLQNAQSSSLEEAERTYQASLAARVAAHWRIEQTLDDRTRERDVLEEAVKQAKSAYDVVVEERNRIQATLAGVEERRAQQAAEGTAQWTAERDALIGKLTDAENRRETLAEQLLIEQNVQRKKLEEAERTYQASLAARVDAHRQIEQTLGDRTKERDILEGAVKQAKSAYDVVAEERNRIQAMLAEVEERRAQQAAEWTAQWTGERDALLGKLTDAEGRQESLASQLVSLQNAQRVSLEEAERTYQASLAARVDAHRQIEQALEDRTRERDVREEAVKQARSAHDVVVEERNRIQATLVEVEERREHQAAERAALWSAERDALLAKLTHAGERCETLAGQLLIEQNVQRTKLQEAERTYQALLAARVDAHRQIAQTLEDRTRERDLLDETVKQAQSACDAVTDDRNRIQAALADAEQRRAHHAAEWGVEREALLARLIALEHAQRENEGALAARSSETEQLKQAMHEARAGFEGKLAASHAECHGLTGQLQDLQRQTAAVTEQWRKALAETLGPLDDASARIERLLHEGMNAGTGSGDGSQDSGEKPAQPVSVSADASSKAESDEETSWTF